jgi:hypothetical protein
LPKEEEAVLTFLPCSQIAPRFARVQAAQAARSSAKRLYTDNPSDARPQFPQSPLKAPIAAIKSNEFAHTYTHRWDRSANIRMTQKIEDNGHHATDCTIYRKIRNKKYYEKIHILWMQRKLKS